MNTTTIDAESTSVPDNLMLARKLAALVHALTGPNTANRERLRSMGNHLTGTHADTKEALREAMEGLRATSLAEGRHEDVLLCAIVKLLDGAPEIEAHMVGHRFDTDNEGLSPLV